MACFVKKMWDFSRRTTGMHKLDEWVAARLKMPSAGGGAAEEMPTTAFEQFQQETDTSGVRIKKKKKRFGEAQKDLGILTLGQAGKLGDYYDLYK